MLKKLNKMLHIKLDPEEIKEINQLIEKNQTDYFSAILDYFANYSDYDLLLQGELAYVGNDCLIAACSGNGGEYEIYIDSYKAKRLMEGKMMVFEMLKPTFEQNDYQL